MLIIASGTFTGMAIVEEIKLRARVAVLERLFHAWTIENAKRRSRNERQVD
jgi:hypothetical protein